MDKKLLIRRIINVLVYLLLIPITLVLGVTVFKDRQYVVVSVVIAFLVLLGFFFSYDRKKTTSKEIAIVTVMVAFSVVGRLIFAAVPSFKPISAIVIISGIALGYEAGFMVGALSAFISNFYFGQGAWTPFQMVSFGLIGLLSGLLFRKNRNIWLILIYGAISGVFYSLVMDVWTVISVDNAFVLERYFSALTVGLPYMAIYIASNVVFLSLLAKPMLKQLDRIKKKYGIVEPYLSKQWFVKMKPLAEASLANQLADTKINFVPERFEKTFRQWMENIEDWCISRQLWWGHRVPAFF